MTSSMITTPGTLATLLAPVACLDCHAEFDYATRKNGSGRCARCYKRWEREGKPERPRRRLTAGSWGYSAAYGTARPPEPDPIASMWADIAVAFGTAKRKAS